MLFKCGICGKSFNNKKTIEEHFLFKHFAEIQDEIDGLEEWQEIEDL